MFAVIYRFKLKSHQEKQYIANWNKVVDFFVKSRGAIGSCLHKGEDDVWVAYSRWPSKQIRDAAWPGDKAPNSEFPSEIQEAIAQMQTIKAENQDLEQFQDMCLRTCLKSQIIM